MSLSIQRLFSVKGHVAVVTGGCSGLGFMISKVRIPLNTGLKILIDSQLPRALLKTEPRYTL